ncbi:MAG: hypothetical protein ACOYIK_04265 [Coriobacteriales bacterium]|jgi:hypothetical protein
MGKLIKSVLIPICGLALAIASLGQLLQAYWQPIFPICGVVALVLLCLVIWKAVRTPSPVR